MSFNHTPSFVYELAREYSLGTPQRRHSQRLKHYTTAFFASIFLIFGLSVMLSYILELLTHEPGAASEWLAILVGVLFFLLLAALYFAISKHSNRVAYECSDGFLVLRGRKQRVELALTWNKVVWGWKERKYLGPRLSTSISYYISYKMGEREENKTYKLFSEQIWQRCAFEVNNRNFQVLPKKRNKKHRPRRSRTRSHVKQV